VRLAGGAAGAPLPAADSSGGLNLSGSAGKVVLATGTAPITCNGSTTNSCSPEELARIVDLAGFGSANFFEGAAAARACPAPRPLCARRTGARTPTPTAPTSPPGAPAPRNSASAPAPCGGTPGDSASPTASCPDALSAEVGTGATATVSATDADSRITTATLTAPPAGITLAGTASTADGAPGTATLTVAPTAATGTYDVEVVVDVSRVTPVSAVQGGGAASPLVDQRAVVEAVVTSLVTSGDTLDGFYVQERVADADPATSEGVSVFCRTRCPAGLAGGDLVRLTGTVDEFNDTTQVDASTVGSTITVLASGQALPAAAVITLPATSSTEDIATFYHLKGMRTTISTTLAVAEYFGQAQFGEILLEAGERSYQYTQINAPSATG
jgi:hypothetical protein